MDKSIFSKKTLKWVQDKGLISSSTYKCLSSKGFEYLTEIQLQAFPPLLSKENVYLKARTGSGKTLAFLVPAIERLKTMKFNNQLGTGVLIISPTRELALQTSNVLLPLCNVHKISCVTLIGGTKNTEDLSKAAVVLGTPGRLAEVIKQNYETPLEVSRLRILILDEADRLLDGGSHTQNVKNIIQNISLEKVQKVLVSATKTEKCLKFAKEILNSEFTEISTETTETPTSHHITQSYLTVDAQDRLAMLVTILTTLKKKKVIVFFNSCHSVKFHYLILSHFNLPVLQCVGQEKQSKRSNKYEKFSTAKRGILLTTGLAERGWDIPNVSWIVQYDPPHRPEDYVHRVGRTGRGESTTGQALLFLRPQEHEFINYLKKMNVSLHEIEFNGELKEIKRKVKLCLSDDIPLREAAKLAYKKFVRAYQCHKLRKIFDITNLDLTELCISFGFDQPPMHMGHLS